MSIKPHTVGIVVHDMAASLAFYRTLGLPIEDGAEHAPHVELEVEGYHMGFTTEAMVAETGGLWTPPTGQRLTLAFRIDSPAEVDATYARMVAAGYEGVRAPWDAFWGQRYAFLRDPDGSRVDIFAEQRGDRGR